MKNRTLLELRANGSREASVTGHHCPQTGWWSADEDSGHRFIARGDVMPALNGLPTRWRLSDEENTSA
ncbi:hypothetical protein ACFC25_18535 [Pseudarthrobacter sp. NPDC055928]|uniref:hypothetical protein n=1 Tax=Pseudarthrobacter sp. NPDC055928 TaxID=3345661 RepID=UPI0035DB45E8